MLLLSVIAQFVILWTLLNMLFKTIFGAVFALYGARKAGMRMSAATVATIFAMSFAVNAVLPVLQNIAAMVAIYRNLKNKLAAWSFKRQYPNVTRGDFANLANGAL